MEKYRNEDGTCKYCGMPEMNLHLDHCRIRIVARDHLRISQEVYDETIAQLSQWDIQDHPTGADHGHIMNATAWRDMTDSAAATGELTWLHIGAEEFWEAFAEEEPEKFEAEAVQAAAVLVSAIASSRRARGV